MKTQRAIHENSLTLALAEIDRLERSRASFVSAKHAAGEQLERQALELAELRELLLAERTRAWARSRREHDRRRERFEHERALDAARAESEHRERLAVYAAELEAKRRQLAELDATPTVERPGRRVLEWAMPVVATVLVAFFAILAVGEDDAGARRSTSPDALASQAAELEPDPTGVIDVESEVAPTAVVDTEPEPIAVAPEPEPPKPAHTKHEPATPKHSVPKTPKNPHPLTLVDPNGDPLGRTGAD